MVDFHEDLKKDILHFLIRNGVFGQTKPRAKTGCNVYVFSTLHMTRIRIQRFTSIRILIRIQGANQCRSGSGFRSEIAETKKLNFSMKK
jgi:hypothetical protein